MNSYDDVKIGDKVFYSQAVGVGHWGVLYFAKTFFIECEVIKLTKTQFVTESGRYRKSDGFCIGDGQNIFKLGETNKWAKGGAKTVTRCEKLDLSNYENELQEIKDAQYVDVGSFRITKVKGLENAQRAASLIKELDGLINNAMEK